VLADNAKHNQDGRVDEHGAIRHKDYSLCVVGALSMLFFVQYHILDYPIPTFEPDFTAPGYGEYGYRAWYDHYVFHPSGHASTLMSYEGEPYHSS
jgi:hypothetical protein